MSLLLFLHVFVQLMCIIAALVVYNKKGSLVSANCCKTFKFKKRLSPLHPFSSAECFHLNTPFINNHRHKCPSNFTFSPKRY